MRSNVLGLRPLQAVVFDKEDKKYGIISCTKMSMQRNRTEVLMFMDKYGDIWHRDGFKVDDDYMDFFATYNDIEYSLVY